MLTLPTTVKIYFYSELVDMRNGIDGLSSLVRGTLKKDPFDGHLFVFVGKTKDKLKILFWDRSGFVLYLKRLEQGRFQLPVVDNSKSSFLMEPAQLAMLLDGIDLNARRLSRWQPTKTRRGIDSEEGF